jgi:hypothetical protein
MDSQSGFSKPSSTKSKWKNNQSNSKTDKNSINNLCVDYEESRHNAELDEK